MEIGPLGLSPARDSNAVQKGAFRIVTPEFNRQQQRFNAGTGLRLATGQVVLSNFVDVDPNYNIDVQPILEFYVATGGYKPGEVVNFTTSSKTAGKCDATGGARTFKVIYNAEGRWVVTPYISSMMTVNEIEGY